MCNVCLIKSCIFRCDGRLLSLTWPKQGILKSGSYRRKEKVIMRGKKNRTCLEEMRNEEQGMQSGLREGDGESEGRRWSWIPLDFQLAKWETPSCTRSNHCIASIAAKIHT